MKAIKMKAIAIKVINRKTGMFAFLIALILSCHTHADIAPSYPQRSIDFRASGVSGATIHVSVSGTKGSPGIRLPHILTVTCVQRNTLYNRITSTTQNNNPAWEHTFVCPELNQDSAACSRFIKFGEINTLMDDPSCSAELLTFKNKYTFSTQGYEDQAQRNFPLGFPYYPRRVFMYGAEMKIKLLLEQADITPMSKEERLEFQDAIQLFASENPPD